MATIVHSLSELEDCEGKSIAVLTVIIVCRPQEVKSAKEAEIENRVEVGMDLDDEVPTLGGLIEQPALQTTEEGKNQQDQEQDQTSLSTMKAKTRRVEASGTMSLHHGHL